MTVTAEREREAGKAQGPVGRDEASSFLNDNVPQVAGSAMHRVKPLWGPNFRVNYYKETKSSLGVLKSPILTRWTLYWGRM